MQKKWLQHPKIPFIYNYGTHYMCSVCEKENMNRGSVRQHVEGKRHRLDFDTGKSIYAPLIPELEQPQSQESNRHEAQKDSIDSLLAEIEEIQEQTFLKNIKNWKKIKQLELIGFPAHLIERYKKDWGFEENTPEENNTWERTVKNLLILTENDPVKQMILAYNLCEGKQRDEVMQVLALYHMTRKKPSSDISKQCMQDKQ